MATIGKTLQTMRDRILIAKDIKEAKIIERWNAASNRFDHNLDHTAFTVAFHDICNSLVAMAVKDSEKRDLLDDIFKGIGEDIRSSGSF